MIIGVSGKLKSGKGEVEKILIDLLPSFTVQSMNKPLKQCAAIILGCTFDQLSDQDFKASRLGKEWSNMTVREFLQRFGMGSRSTTHEDIWINSGVRELEGDAIIDSVRLENEANHIEYNRGIIIRVVRPIEKRFPKLWKKFKKDYKNRVPLNEDYFIGWLSDNDKEMYDQVEHESETGLDNYIFENVIYNNGSVKSIKNEVVKILAHNNIS